MAKPLAPRMLFSVALIGTAVLVISSSLAETAREIPPAAVDSTPDSQATSEIAVLAGGCFWGVQGVFQHVQGVNGVVSGYAGGDQAMARYALVGTGATGHAEAVRITFDPRKISYGRILQIFFSVAHNPTELDRQGPDVGAQYRSAVFPTTAEQARIASRYIGQLNQARVFDAAIVTKIEPGKRFFPAEAYHQDFLARNPQYPYIVIHDLPKVRALERLFPNLYRKQPVLVSGASVLN